MIDLFLPQGLNEVTAKEWAKLVDPEQTRPTKSISLAFNPLHSNIRKYASCEGWADDWFGRVCSAERSEAHNSATSREII